MQPLLYRWYLRVLGCRGGLGRCGRPCRAPKTKNMAITICSRATISSISLHYFFPCTLCGSTYVRMSDSFLDLPLQVLDDCHVHKRMYGHVHTCTYVHICLACFSLHYICFSLKVCTYIHVYVWFSLVVRTFCSTIPVCLCLCICTYIEIRTYM